MDGYTSGDLGSGGGVAGQAIVAFLSAKVANSGAAFDGAKGDYVANDHDRETND